jgi:hypothetical protein
VHAITAAGVLQAVARSCRNGDLNTCGCSTSKRPENLNKDWMWGGCGDNVEYAYKFTKTFIDMSEKSLNDDRHALLTSESNNPNYRVAMQLNRYKKSKGQRATIDTYGSHNSIEIRRAKARRLVNLHNNEAGRRVSFN